MTLTIPDTNALNDSAEKILSAFPQARVFAFYGELGAGKTTLIKALCTKAGVTDAMNSPTYAIVNQYNGKEIVYHIDLYRLKSIKEAFGIGIEDYLNSKRYCFIEWPAIIEPLLPPGTVKIYMSVNEDELRELDIKKI
jgi:tRNA threonylcarbamoyladenosine biosynthesis protein TsaE